MSNITGAMTALVTPIKNGKNKLYQNH